jgi:acetyl-CoA C-acetyltransferase
MKNDVLVLGAARTPIGRCQGGLSSVPAPNLGAVAIRGALERAALAAVEIEVMYFGNVLQAGLGQAPARQAALAGGLPESVCCTTVHKVCGSGMEAVILASRALAAGDAEAAVAGGMENMSRAPYLLPEVRGGYRLGHRQTIDSMVHDGLWDPYNQLHMGACADACAKELGIKREEQDALARDSYRRANTAQKAGLLAGEIVPVAVKGKDGAATVVQDEEPGRVDYERLPKLSPAFTADGTITAGNASKVNDGAAALVLGTAAFAAERGYKPLARIVSSAGFAQAPLWFTSAPVDAARGALARAGWKSSDVDLWEVNEAFAVVPLVFQRQLGIRAERLNVWGGAIALGHPIGASGARILVTLLHALQHTGQKRGVAAICLGGGEGLAVCLERVEAS